MPRASVPLACPNCGEPVDSAPIHCPLCGYQSESVREYFWLYAGGAGLALAGIAVGTGGVVLEGLGSTGWSRALAGWFPLGPWPAGWHWLAFTVEGILWTLIGLGFTRRRRAAFWSVLALVAWESAWALRELVRGALAKPTAEAAAQVHPASSPALAAAVLVWEAVLLALALRLGLALRRTPPRNAAALQEGARRRRQSSL